MRHNQEKTLAVNEVLGTVHRGKDGDTGAVNTVWESHAGQTSHNPTGW